MATNEQLQAQVDALREALGEVLGLGLVHNSVRLTNRPPIEIAIAGKRQIGEALERYDAVRREAD
jgi:hypothetical protein